MPQDTRLSYKDFTAKEIQLLVDRGVLNGIGPSKPRWLYKFVKWYMHHLLHSWLTEASGNIHDLSYTFGGTERDRYDDDMGFYLMILHDAVNNSKSSLSFLARSCVGIVFKTAVRVGGMRRFHYGEYRTKEEVMDLRFKK